MRSPGAYYLLLLYITVIIKPFMPLVSDAWAHEFAETLHVSTVHAKYGSNHLEKEMAASGAENENGKTQNTVKAAEQVPVHIVTDGSNYVFNLNRNPKIYPLFYLHKGLIVFLPYQAPPPKF